jgi:hypothetical protein
LYDAVTVAPLTRVSHVGSARPFFAAGPADSAFVNRIVVTVCRAPYEHSGFWLAAASGSAASVF